MSARASPVRIGAFVVGAVALVLAGLIAFGSGAWLQERVRYVAYFDGSVTGLRVGAPVMLRGVPIGQVTQVMAEYDPENDSVRVPVYFEAIRDTVRGFGDIATEDVPELIRRFVDEGLRARLAPLSFVTGQLYIQLALHPGTPANLQGAPREEDDVIEIPTIPSQFEVLESRLSGILGDDDEDGGLEGVTRGIGQLVDPQNQAAVREILANLATFTGALGEGQGDVSAILAGGRQVVERVDEVAQSIDGLVGEARHAVEQIDLLATDLAGERDEVNALVADMRGAASSVGRMGDQINAAVAENRPGLLDFTENTLPAVDGLVLDLEQLTQQLSRVADNLERDPSGFLFGGQGPQGIQTR
jgi:paraquat-inducible protein B